MRALISSPAQAEVRGAAKNFSRLIIALSAAGGDVQNAALVYRARWPNSKGCDLIEKAATSAGSMDGEWGIELAPLEPLAAAYLEVMRPLTVMGRLEGLRDVPLNVKFPRQTGAASVGWTREGSTIQVSALAFDEISLPPAKIAGLVAISRELARSSDPAAEQLVERDLGRAIAAFLDRQFLDPTVAAIDGQTPASVTHGGVSVAASGTTAAAFKSDANELLRQMTAAGGVFASPAWVMSPRMAISLAMMGVDPHISLSGGSLFGVPLLTSTDAPSSGDSPDNDTISLLDAAGISVADGGLQVTTSDQGTVQLSTAPDSPATGSTVEVSLWQQGLVGILATRQINYARLNGGSAGVITGAAYEG